MPRAGQSHELFRGLGRLVQFLSKTQGDYVIAVSVKKQNRSSHTINSIQRV